MKRLIFISTLLLAFSSAAFAQMSNGHGGGMMGGNWGWGMSYGWGFGLIIAVLVILGVIYAMKRR